MVRVLYVFPEHPPDELELAAAHDRQAFELVLLLGKGVRKRIPVAPQLDVYCRSGNDPGRDSNFIFDGVEVFGPAVVARSDGNGELVNISADDVEEFKRRCSFRGRSTSRW